MIEIGLPGRDDAELLAAALLAAAKSGPRLPRQKHKRARELAAEIQNGLEEVLPDE